MSETFIITPELLEKGRQTPVINRSPLPKYRYDALDYGMTIGIERSPGGRLFSCWVAGGDNPAAYFVLAYSDDDGITWNEPSLVIDPHDDTLGCERSTIVGCLWTDPLGRLWLFFSQTLEHFDGASSNWYIRCDNPDTDSPVWGEPVYLWYGATLNKPVVLSNGDWLLPISIWERRHISHPFEECYRELDGLRGASVFASRDEGESWTFRGRVAYPESDYDEHIIIQRHDGSLRMLARTANGIYESFSRDMGATWSAPVRSVIEHISARFNIRRLLSGNLLLVKHGRTVEELTQSRCELTAFISEDDGESWKGGLVLDERFEVSYPDSVQSPDGYIYIQYDYNRASAGHILYAKVTEKDILNGRTVIEGSRLRAFVSVPFGLEENRRLLGRVSG
ncbi:MAG: sialidase family protein [Eubacteriales bacterium]